MDPYASPQADDSRPIGELSAATTVSDAVSGLLRNLIPWIGVMITYTAIVVLGFCTVFGWIVAVPLMLWGLQAFALEAIDGPARFNTLFDGWKDLGTTMARVWGLAVVGFVAFGVILAPPMLLVSIPELQAIMEGESPDQNILTIKWFAVSTLGSLLFVRFQLVLPLIVERGRPLLESITESWQRTNGHWLTLIGLMLLLQLLNLPTMVVSLGLNQLNDPSLPPEQVLENLPLLAGAYFGSVGLQVITSVFMMMVFASVFRQLAGPAPAKASV